MSAAPRARVLVVDDEPALRRALARALVRDFEVLTAEDGASALGLLSTTRVDAVLLDLGMPRMGGAEVLARIREARHDAEVVVMAAHAELDAAAAAVRAGAFGLVTKPLDEGPALALALERAVERRRLARRVRALEARLGEHERLGELVGSSARMADVQRRALGVAAASATVLLQGERGTGKELVARFIHQRSPRADKRFVSVSCGAVPAGVIEEELFGCAAPPPIVRNAAGLFELADQGTLFLDEIGDLPHPAQVALLGALSTGEVRRVGAGASRRVDVRVIAATHVDLRELVAAGRLREDLSYRLGVVTIHVPPLRQRKEDIPLLAHHFLQRYGQRDGRSVRRISVEAMRRLREHPWPGNVRELESAIEHAAIVARGGAILPADLPPPLSPQDGEPGASGRRRRRRGAEEALALPPELVELPYAAAKERLIGAFDRAYVERLLARSGGNVSEAARQAGMDRPNFRRLRRRASEREGGEGAGEARDQGDDAEDAGLGALGTPRGARPGAPNDKPVAR
ncbi:MAG: sigma-54-dependent Fis family transcriptional regulator [Polyangiaceae bacterium]|nr:sigma-54-dependent Fis family transcriptional regulator [Polyangiaceae bacterium]